MTDMSGRPIQRFAFIGFGLIGGSLALALRRADPEVRLCIYDPDPVNTQHALDTGMVDELLPTADVPGDHVDMIILTAPPRVCSRWLQERTVPAGVVVTDVCSVKGGLIEAARAMSADTLPQFVPGHPIAGTEGCGCVSADAGLFQHCQVVLTPLAQTNADAVDAVKNLWRRVGADNVHTMPAEEHDRLLAASSHLPHMLSYALVDMLRRREHSEEFMQMAGGGLASFSRVTASSPVMWSEISTMNKDCLLVELEEYQQRLQALTEQVRCGDESGLRSLFADIQSWRIRTGR